MSPSCKSRFAFLCVTGFVLVSGFPSALLSQDSGPRSQSLITERIDEAKLQTLAGNTHPQANKQNDLGPAPDGVPMEHMMLQLQRPAEQDQAARQFIDQLHDPKSPNYHHWLTAAQFGEAYGPSPLDIAAVTSWLQLHGFTVNGVTASGMVIDFSGTSGQVSQAFHTQIHYVQVNGQQHIANGALGTGLFLYHLDMDGSRPDRPALTAPEVRCFRITRWDRTLVFHKERIQPRLAKQILRQVLPFDSQ
jgi:hypothetical protein